MAADKKTNKARPRLTAREARFVDEYLVDLNRTAAYVRAFPGTGRATARVEGSRLLARPAVRRAVMTALRKRAGVSAERVVRELAFLAFSDVGDVLDMAADEWAGVRPPRAVPAAARRAIRAVKVSRRADGGETIQVKMYDKPRALDLLMRHLGLYRDLPPLEAVLLLLPAAVREAVRAELVAGAGDGG